LEPGDARASNRAKGVTATTIRVGSEASPLGVQDWVDQPNDKLERQLGDIVTALLNRAERALRVHANLQFERRVERRRELQAEIAAAEHAKQVRRQEALAAHESKVRQEIVDLSLERKTAQDIRDLVAALADHPDIGLGAGQLFSDWKDKALSVADELDPLKRPLSDALKVFGGTPTDCDDQLRMEIVRST
jgi:hypothetical protein